MTLYAPCVHPACESQQGLPELCPGMPHATSHKCCSPASLRDSSCTLTGPRNPLPSLFLHHNFSFPCTQRTLPLIQHQSRIHPTLEYLLPQEVGARCLCEAAAQPKPSMKREKEKQDLVSNSYSHEMIHKFSCKHTFSEWMKDSLTENQKQENSAQGSWFLGLILHVLSLLIP